MAIIICVTVEHCEHVTVALMFNNTDAERRTPWRLQLVIRTAVGIFSLGLELEFRITVAARCTDRTHGSDLELCVVFMYTYTHVQMF